MKLLSFMANGKPGFGSVKDGGIVDLSRRLSGRGITTLRQLLTADGLAMARTLVHETAPDFALESVILAPVIPDPDKIICVGLNYSDHVAETGRTVTEKPALFGRYAGSQVGHLQPLVKPSVWTNSTMRVSLPW